MSCTDQLVPVSDTDYLRAQRFLHHEAALLDAHDYRAWWLLLAEDMVYRVWTQVVRPGNEQNDKLTIVDEGIDRLQLRVDQLADPKLTHAENPRTLTRRYLSNFQMFEDNQGSSIIVSCNLLVFLNRCPGVANGFLAGVRHDVLQVQDHELRLARRDVKLDQTILTAGTLSILL